MPLGAVLLTANVVFLIAGGFIYSGGFLGIEGYGYGWDKTRWGLLVLLLALRALRRSATWCRTRSRSSGARRCPRRPRSSEQHPELAVAPTPV